MHWYSIAPRLGFVFFVCLSFAPVLWGQAEQDPLALARSYYERQEYQKALDQLEDRPPSPPVYDLTYKSLLALEEYRAAEKLAQRYRDRFRGQAHNYTTDLLYLCDIQGEDRKRERLEEDILNTVRAQPNQAYRYGPVLQKAGYPALALRVYQSGEEQNPGFNFDYNKALLYGELGDIPNMYQMYVQMVENQPAYLPSVKNLLTRSLDPAAIGEAEEDLIKTLIGRIQQGARPEITQLLVHIYVQLKNFRSAYRQLKALDRQGKIAGNELLQLARVVRNNGEFALATSIYAYLVQKGPDFPYHGDAVLGAFQSRLQAYEADTNTQSKQWLQLVEEGEDLRPSLVFPELQHALNQDLARIYAYRLGQVDTAEGLLRTALKDGRLNATQRAELQIALGDLLLYRDRRWDAIVCYARAELDMEQSPVGQEAKFKKAKAAYFAGDFTWAQSLFDILKRSTSKLIANDALHYALLIDDNVALDSNTEAMQSFAKAELYAYQEQWDSALFVLERMDIAYADHNILDETWLLAGDIHYRRKAYRQAQQYWERILAGDPRDILVDDALFRLGRLAEEKFRNQSQAQEYYRRIFIDLPDSYFAPEARERFRMLRGDSLN